MAQKKLKILHCPHCNGSVNLGMTGGGMVLKKKSRPETKKIPHTFGSIFGNREHPDPDNADFGDE